ncbi:YihY/virulence factor BrkB family protein [Streptomyces sp. NBC_01142]|uniref:YihY/virulence factor BrkB family protein n=1 Tax=Streptomyces sp. NBC_01142 TaxID=2975865 RepID=UPI0022597754|nr:YihY/virulence factor BrkB family protein [Streptomyces sp. NBC_01142]MCX4820949.1 YihY/virulence factor BrkB family protein [Streptomyces sp. NBC_01142]
MGSAAHVPQTRDMAGEELSGDEAWAALRRYGGQTLLTDAFLRFRYADGFSHSRALAFQVTLALVPFTIALVGVATTLHTESVGRIVELTLTQIAPGASSRLIEDALAEGRRNADSDAAGAVAMWLGLGFAVVSLTSAMAQIERGANRIYGIERDRPFGSKYGRSLLLSVAAGAPMAAGFLVLVAGDAVAEAAVKAFGGDAGLPGWWHWLQIPVGISMAWVASAAIFRWAPRRTQPGYTWLAFGSAVHLTLWITATWLLALYVEHSGSFGAVYGPLTAFVALLLWANLTGIALFLGLAFAAQLEAARAGITEPVHPDPGPGS